MSKKKAKAPAAPSARPRRWARRPARPRPRPRRPDVIVVGTAPIAEILIYDDMLLYGRRDTAGRWRSYPISADALAQTLGNVPVSMGLLPLSTIGAGRMGGRPFLVRLVPAAQTTLQTPERSYTIPLPPMVWAGCGTDYRVFALAPEGRISNRMPLYLAPLPNCYSDGRICWGTVQGVPSCDGATLDRVLGLFLTDSQFNLHIAGSKSKAYPVSVLAQWAALEAAGATEYPLDDLEAAGSTLDDLLSGRMWGGQA